MPSGIKAGKRRDQFLNAGALPTRLCRYLVTSSAILLFLSVSPLCIGQDTATRPDAVDPALDQEQEQPAPIETADFTSRVSADRLHLQRIRRLLEPGYTVSTLPAELTGEDAAIASLVKDLGQIDAASVSTRSLDDHRRRWQELQERQSHWMNEVDARWKALQEACEELDGKP